MSDRSIVLIVLHCSATPTGQAVTVYDIDRWHAERGFQRQPEAVAAFNPSLGSIGYHYFIDLQGQVFSGRSPAEIGAHVAGHNAHSLGVCMAGTDKFTPAQWSALADLVRSLQADYPQASVVGHRDLSPDADGDGVVEPREWLKTCPGFDVSTWLARGMVPEAAATVPT